MSWYRRLILSVLVALIPCIVLIVLIAATQQSTVFDKHLFESDEEIHWSQAAAFRAAGFNSGYFTANERTAPLQQIHFYSWGPVAPVLYGLISYVTGWEFYTPILINLALLGIATVAFIHSLRLGGRQIAWLALLLATYPPLVTYAPTVMLEVLNQALAIGLAILFARYIVRQTITNKALLTITIAVCVASTFRATWSLLLIPVFLIYFADNPTRRKAVVGFVAVTALIGGMFLLYVTWSSPYPNTPNRIAAVMADDFQRGLLSLANHAVTNLRLVFEGETSQLVLRLQMLVIVIGVLFPLRRILRGGSPARQDWRLALVCGCSLPVIFIFNVVGYEMTNLRDYRVFAPFVLFALLLLVAGNRQKLLGTLIAISLISYTGAFPRYRVPLVDFSPANNYDSQLQANSIQFKELGIHYDPNAVSAWCNSVLYTRPYFRHPEILLAFDEGIGLSLLFPVSYLPDTVRSRYLLFDDDNVTLLEGHTRIKLLADLPQGGLYENLDAACT